MENADAVQKLFERVGTQLADPAVDVVALQSNLHELVRSGHVCASPIAVRVLCELLTNGRLCPENWLLAFDYASIAFSSTDTPTVNDTIAEIVAFRKYAHQRFDGKDESVPPPKWLLKNNA